MPAIPHVETVQNGAKTAFQAIGGLRYAVIGYFSKNCGAVFTSKEAAIHFAEIISNVGVCHYVIDLETGETVG